MVPSPPPISLYCSPPIVGCTHSLHNLYPPPALLLLLSGPGAGSQDAPQWVPVVGEQRSLVMVLEVPTEGNLRGKGGSPEHGVSAQLVVADTHCHGEVVFRGPFHCCPLAIQHEGWDGARVGRGVLGTGQQGSEGLAWYPPLCSLVTCKGLSAAPDAICPCMWASPQSPPSPASLWTLASSAPLLPLHSHVCCIPHLLQCPSHSSASLYIPLHCLYLLNPLHPITVSITSHIPCIPESPLSPPPDLYVGYGEVIFTSQPLSTVNEDIQDLPSSSRTAPKYPCWEMPQGDSDLATVPLWLMLQ